MLRRREYQLGAMYCVLCVLCTVCTVYCVYNVHRTQLTPTTPTTLLLPTTTYYYYYLLLPTVQADTQTHHPTTPVYQQHSVAGGVPVRLHILHVIDPIILSSYHPIILLSYHPTIDPECLQSVYYSSATQEWPTTVLPTVTTVLHNRFSLWEVSRRGEGIASKSPRWLTSQQPPVPPLFYPPLSCQPLHLHH
ncbi:hypothetical protein B484DRAFT_442600 [Ochromonadaceae sp. CCMP2298]|nr:hypothetical protein B484DRAFT_442600 [Ochromonadaceae sp. CCMP2298]